MTKLTSPQFHIHEAVQALRDEKRRFDLARSEMMEGIARSRETIARSRALTADAEALLAWGKRMLTGG